jgi:radical S-adenosyl methionine domain-containing protein 2
LFTGKYLDILAISCDSFDEETNTKIGRSQGSKAEQTKLLRKIRDWCEEYRVLFKINTVVNRYNLDEDLSEGIVNLNPIRWRVSFTF